MEAQIQNDSILENIPKVGMIFESESQAYDFYNRYARSTGFSVRQYSSSIDKDKRVIRRVLCCSKEGLYQKHSRGSPLNPRLKTRTECEARIIIKRHGDVFHVVEFKEMHNHELAPPNEVYHLRSQRKIMDSQARVMRNMHYAGIGSTDIYSYMSAEVGGPQNLNFTQIDCINQIQRMRRSEILEKGDAQLLLEYFASCKKANPYFFYSIQMDGENQMCSCFWADAKSRVDYSFFGDVVCFDTTYNTNNYDKPFAPFVGVNNHGQTIFFGCALLLDETTNSFVWLFQTFIEAMNGRRPKCIFTDQAQAIGNAIEEVFPETHHYLCLWHIYQNAAKHLSHVFENFKDFTRDFKDCIYEKETEEEFQSSWNELLSKYNLKENSWLHGLYQLREKWAQVYMRKHFCAGMYEFII